MSIISKYYQYQKESDLFREMIMIFNIKNCNFFKKVTIILSKKIIINFSKNNNYHFFKKIMIMISPKNIICNANSLENTKKSLKLFRSESGASEIIMYIMYLVMLCKYVHMYVNNI